MKPIVIAIAFIGLIVSSCSNGEEKVHIKTVKSTTNNSTTQKIAVNTKLNIEITGMSCEKGCGGTIRKALKATGGVDRVSYDFVDERETQIAEITLDSNKIDLEKIKKIITELNKNQFSVGKTEWESVN